MEPSLSPLQTHEPPAPSALPELSERELEVLRLVATGVGNKEIAQQLFISPNTVKVHLRNIFSKIGAASRTEAAMYALREGLVTLPASATPEAASAVLSPEAALASALGATPSPASALSRRLWQRWAILAVLVIALLSLAGGWLAIQFQPAPAPTPAAPPTPPRWQTLADMPTARSGLAAAAVDNHIYAIGGENSSGVIGAVERYDLLLNSWEVLPSLPIPVADVSAAVIGGQIYVPGGRLASGEITSTLAVYNPRDQRWGQLAPMPAARSAYALATFEGRIYVFGGWDSQKYVNSVYEYQPDLNQWNELSPMPTARGYAGAGVANGRIYVVGGYNLGSPLAVNEAFSPNPASSTASWKAYAPLPAATGKMGVTSLVNTIFLVGGTGAAPNSAVLEYFAQLDEWSILPGAVSAPTLPGVTAQGTILYSLGGEVEHTYTRRLLAYQAIYIVSIPLVK